MTKKLIDRDKAFEMYYALGTSRSMPILHDQMSRKPSLGVPSARTLKDWSQKYNWQDRILLRDNAVRDGIQESASAVVVEAKIKELEHLYNGMNTVDTSLSLISDTLELCIAEDPKTGKRKVTIRPETTQDMTALYNAQSRFVAAKVKLVETVRKIMGEADKHEFLTTVKHEVTDDPDILKSANELAKQLSCTSK